jgi:LysR family glycine cleavage system transcriptional activator
MNISRSMIPDLAQLQAFECATRHGSFTKAALELSLTQSAVSRQVKALEEQLGVLLFERVRKRVVLSTAGRQMLGPIKRLLAQSEDVVMQARSATEGKAVLSIATLPTFGTRWLLPRLKDFFAKHPGLQVDVASRSQPFDLAGEGFDLAIHYGQPVWASATCTYLCSEVIQPVASPALLAEGAPSDCEDLVGRPLLHLATRPKLWAEWFRHHDAEGEFSYKGNRFDQFSMVIEAAISGIGFALLPLYLIEDEIRSGKLCIALDSPMATENSYYVVVPEGHNESPGVDAFRQWITAQVGKKPTAMV